MFRVILNSSCDLHTAPQNSLSIALSTILTDQKQYRSDKARLGKIIRLLHKAGYDGGKLRIIYVENEDLAHTYADIILQAFPTAEIKICPSTTLCSFYAEKSGILMGIETK